MAIALVGCGGGESTTETDGSAATPAKPSASLAPKTGSREKDRRSQPEDEEPATAKEKPRQAKSSAPDTQATKKKAGTAAGDKPADRNARQTSNPCPAGIDASDCEQAAKQLDQAPSSPGSPQPEGCPKGLSKDECQALAEDLEKQPDHGGSASETDCPPGISATECRAFAEALGK
ncbi:MAG TPA: hypothetical protein VFT79_14005 [Solirubrobacterales bacterium]|nr:hypothetical protein [Solirubrobacterales bacterium]